MQIKNTAATIHYQTCYSANWDPKEEVFTQLKPFKIRHRVVENTPERYSALQITSRVTQDNIMCFIKAPFTNLMFILSL